MLLLLYIISVPKANMLAIMCLQKGKMEFIAQDFFSQISKLIYCKKANLLMFFSVSLISTNSGSLRCLGFVMVLDLVWGRGLAMMARSIYEIVDLVVHVGYSLHNNNNNIAFFSQASWSRLEMKPERNKFKVQAH